MGSYFLLTNILLLRAIAQNQLELKCSLLENVHSEGAHHVFQNDGWYQELLKKCAGVVPHWPPAAHSPEPIVFNGANFDKMVHYCHMVATNEHLARAMMLNKSPWVTSLSKNCSQLEQRPQPSPEWHSSLTTKALAKRCAWLESLEGISQKAWLHRQVWYMGLKRKCMMEKRAHPKLVETGSSKPFQIPFERPGSASPQMAPSPSVVGWAAPQPNPLVGGSAASPLATLCAKLFLSGRLHRSPPSIQQKCADLGRRNPEALTSAQVNMIEIGKACAILREAKSVVGDELFRDKIWRAQLERQCSQVPRQAAPPEVNLAMQKVVATVSQNKCKWLEEAQSAGLAGMPWLQRAPLLVQLKELCQEETMGTAGGTLGSPEDSILV